MKNTVMHEQKRMLSRILFTIIVIEVKSIRKLNMITNILSVDVSF